MHGYWFLEETTVVGRVIREHFTTATTLLREKENCLLFVGVRIIEEFSVSSSFIRDLL